MIEGIKWAFLSTSAIISEYAYRIVPSLYIVFMDLANFKFLSNEFIYKVWNNIYVLVGVVVLFAIAIKLISAMVNPDTLTDNKKGAKGAYFRAVFAVILIFICPFAFDLMYKVQTDLLDDNFLMGRVFGYEIDGATAGQMLAWESFSAFCYPIDSNGDLLAEEDAEETYPYYYYMQYNISFINKTIDEYVIWNAERIGYIIGGVTPLGSISADVGAAVGSAIDSTNSTSMEYHAILCPLMGCLLVYELFLLCMDTMFRSAKMAILELMLPIVLGAYVFSPEILSKWAKEFFSTYITVFLKMLAIGFMIIAINELKGVIF